MFEVCKFLILGFSFGKLVKIRITPSTKSGKLLSSAKFQWTQGEFATTSSPTLNYTQTGTPSKLSYQCTKDLMVLWLWRKSGGLWLFMTSIA